MREKNAGRRPAADIPPARRPCDHGIFLKRPACTAGIASAQKISTTTVYNNIGPGGRRPGGNDEAGADRIRAFLTDCGARRYLESLARDYSRRGLERLSAPHVPSALRDVLIPVADEVLERVK